MDMLDTLREYFLHSDRHLAHLVTLYGPWVYGLLFAIVFAETGLIVTPFLPGDSLLFAAGAIAALGGLDPLLLIGLLSAAAILGDAVNYSLGRRYGLRLIDAVPGLGHGGRTAAREHVTQAQAFFARHGGKAIVLGRFAPFIRTFVPFAAGMAGMHRPAFTFYNVTGAFVWVGGCAGAGYLFGTVPIVRDHFPVVALGIVGVSLLPAAAGAIRHMRRPSPAQEPHPRPGQG